MDLTPSNAPRKALKAVGEGIRIGRSAAVILRSGVVPSRLDKGLTLVPSLLRFGTTFPGLVGAATAAVGDRPAIVDDHGLTTYRQLNERATALSVGLSKRLDIGEGDAVGLLARNDAAFVESLVAIGRLGAHAILLNTGMSPAQANVVVEQQAIKALIVDADLDPLLERVPEDVPRVRCGVPRPGDGVSTAGLIEAGRRRKQPKVPEETGRTVVMTSGTTGAPKGAKRPTTGGADALGAILSILPITADDRVMIAPPLFHTLGLAVLQLAVGMRSTVFLRRDFDPATFMADLSSHRVSTVAVVPVMLQRVLELDDADLPARDRSHLKVVACSGSALSGDLALSWMNAFGDNLYNLYGSTEASWATIANPKDLRAAPGTAGRPPLGTTVRIVDDAGVEVPKGEVGRIFVGNSMPFEGYTGNVPGKEMIDGLMSTGDMGHLDPGGRLFVSGRDDDMIVSGGENVFPKETEDLLAARDDVREVAVIGVDDEDFGQRMIAFVVPRDPDGPLTESELRDYVKANLAKFSVPREVRFLDELPRNPTGKVVPKRLRDLLD